MLVKVVWNRPVRCPNWEQGCAWTAILGQEGANLATINQHVAECSHRVVKCQVSVASFTFVLLCYFIIITKHVVQWPGCKQTGPKDKVALHEKVFVCLFACFCSAVFFSKEIISSCFVGMSVKDG